MITEKNTLISFSHTFVDSAYSVSFPLKRFTEIWKQENCFSVELCIKSIWELALQNCLVFRYLLSSICCFRNVWRCIKLQFWNCAWDFWVFLLWWKICLLFCKVFFFLGWGWFSLVVCVFFPSVVACLFSLRTYSF